jgi:hypothetical protein
MDPKEEEVNTGNAWGVSDEEDDPWGEDDEIADPDFEYQESDGDPLGIKGSAFMIVPFDQVRQKMTEVVNKVVELLMITEDETIARLIPERWNSDKVIEKAMNGEE